MGFPKFKTKKSAQIAAAIFYIVFLLIYSFQFYIMPPHQNEVQIVSIIAVSIGIIFIWAISIGYLFTLMFSGRPDISVVVWFTISFLTFLICQILAFAVLYKATGIETKGTIDDTAYLYFSVMTLTTVGYGDITPKDAGRIFAMIQVLSGYIYLGVFIGIITSLMMSVKQDIDPITTENKP